MLVLNDVHIGVQRKGGTTPASQESLRNYLLASFESILADTNETKLVIAGDLFDDFDVPARDWLQCYMILQDWCVRTAGELVLVAGNHDWSPRGAKVSSFEMLCAVLLEQFGPERVTVIGIDQWKWVVEPPDHPTAGMIALAHCSNQETFDAKLAEVLVVADAGTRVLIHANYDNNFAAQSDHSLNVSAEQALAFKSKGVTLYFAHEHQAKVALGGSVVVMGNQWPTSISDCLDNDKKYAHVFKADDVEKIETWCGADEPAGFCEVDWKDLGDAYTDCGGFFRVGGEATASQAGEVMTAIAKFRAKSAAFVVTNAVRIEGMVEAAELPEQFEAAKKFDVMQFIRENLSEAEFRAVTALLEETE